MKKLGILGLGLVLLGVFLSCGPGISLNGVLGAPSLFGSALQFNGTNNYVSFGTTSGPMPSIFTLEAFIILSSTPTTPRAPIIVLAQSGGSSPAVSLYVDNSNHLGGSFVNPGACVGTMAAVGMAVPINIGQRYHVVFSHDATNYALFVNGLLINPGTAASSGGCAAYDMYVGYDAAGNYFPGIIDEVRYSTVARYNANFTPPTAPFILDGNTALLFHFDNRNPSGTVSGSNPQVNFNLMNNPVYINSPFP